MSDSVLDQFFKEATKSIMELEETLVKYGYKPVDDPEWEEMKNEVLKDE